MKLTAAATALTAVAAATGAAVAVATPAEPYIVQIEGTIAGGFNDTYSDGTVAYGTADAKARAACYELRRDAENYCLGHLDGYQDDHLAFKVSLGQLR